MGNPGPAIQSSTTGKHLAYEDSQESSIKTTPDDTSHSKKPARTVNIESMDQLLREVYAGDFKRQTLKKGEINALRNSPKLAILEQEELLNRVLSTDRTLNRTRQLLLLSVGLDAQNIIHQIQEFVSLVFHQHPSFKTNSLREGVKYLSGGLKQDQAIEELARQDYAKLNWPEGMEELKKNEHKKCKENTICCLLLWLWITRRIISVTKVMSCLQSHVWKPAAKRRKTEAEKLRVLITTRDHAAASLTNSMLENLVLQEQQSADGAIKARERAVAKLEELNQELETTSVALKESQERVNQFTKEREEINQKHADEKAHLKNDYVQLRGRVLRCFRSEMTLLEEGLQAIRLDSPKVHVTIDHLERVIDSLRREIDRISEEQQA